VKAARDVQTARYAAHGIRTNAEADGELLDGVAAPDEPGRRLLAQAAEAMRLSARGYHRVLRVSRPWPIWPVARRLRECTSRKH
jgi:magnesium chelatase family protein